MDTKFWLGNLKGGHLAARGCRWDGKLQNGSSGNRVGVRGRD
jgi:hypothetical protein